MESDTLLVTAEARGPPARRTAAGRFTAVGYFFARDLQQKLGVPMGIIDCSWGGSAIEPWLSQEALSGDSA